MSATPLCDALRSFAAQHPLRMHMPGHKGRVLPLMEASSLSPLDVTELPPTGDLFAGGGAIGEAEALWAETFHMARCLFLTGGSTQGMLAALTMFTWVTNPIGSQLPPVGLQCSGPAGLKTRLPQPALAFGGGALRSCSPS